MKTEQEIKARVTPEIIKQMCALAEGFENTGAYIFHFMGVNYSTHSSLFPLLIHRAVDGFNKIERENGSYLDIDNESIWMVSYKENFEEIGFEFKDYKSDTLTAVELACLDCLIDIT